MQEGTNQQPEAAIPEILVDEVWNDLVGEWHDRVRRWCRAACGDYHMGDDLAQEVFLSARAAYLKGKLTIDPSAIRRWFWVVIHTRAGGIRTACKGGVPFELELDERTSSAADESVVELDEWQYRRQRFREAIQYLRPQDRSLLEAEIKGTPLRTLADTLDVSIEAIMKRRQRAINKVRVAIGREAGLRKRATA